MRKRSDGFPAGLLATALILVWTVAIGLAAASNRPPPAQSNAPSTFGATKTVPPAGERAADVWRGEARSAGRRKAVERIRRRRDVYHVSRDRGKKPPRVAARQIAERAHARGSDRPVL